MAEKTKQNTTAKHIPKDAQVIMSIMRDMDISEYEPRVINQLLEFTYRYVACILEDAKTYANHAKKKSIDLDDVKLALQIQLEHTFTTAPPRELLTEVARSKNSIQLPLIKPHCGIRLPQDRYCLASCNLKIKLPQFTKKTVKLSNTSKMVPKANIGVVKRAGNLPTVSRTQSVSIPKPVVKFNTTAPKTMAKPKINISQSSNSVMMDEDSGSSQLKRKREDDYDMSM